MLGWEFPPAFSGGLGIVTKELSEALLQEGADLTLLLPQFIAQEAQKSDIPSPALKKKFHKYSKKICHFELEKLKTIHIPTNISSPYVNKTQYHTQTQREKCDKFLFRELIQDNETITPANQKKKNIYGAELYQEIQRFVGEVLIATEGEHFDLVHAHDWITAEAAIQLKLTRNIPFIIHIHATEFDRTGNWSIDTEVARREQYAMELADKVITVSHYTKQLLADLYHIPREKIEVLHNAYSKEAPRKPANEHWTKDKSQFWVLFIGRVTLQKGPDYFVEMARIVAKQNPNIHFLIAGDGDMMPSVINQIAKHKLNKNVHCLGFLTPEERDALYLYTDACVIPSVSEPFGLTAIEGVAHNCPLVLSKTCGANELIGHKLSIDFWNTEEMAEYVLALAKYPWLRRTLRHKALHTLPPVTWNTQAKELLNIYKTIK